jgi:hypothetical protein
MSAGYRCRNRGPIRLKRLAQVQATENVPPEFQPEYLKELPPEYTGDRHIVTVGRDPNGTYRWEERPGPGPGEGKGDSHRLRVALALPEDDPPAPGA